MRRLCASCSAAAVPGGIEPGAPLARTGAIPRHSCHATSHCGTSRPIQKRSPSLPDSSLQALNFCGSSYTIQAGRGGPRPRGSLCWPRRCATAAGAERRQVSARSAAFFLPAAQFIVRTRLLMYSWRLPACRGRKAGRGRREGEREGGRGGWGEARCHRAAAGLVNSAADGKQARASRAPLARRPPPPPLPAPARPQCSAGASCRCRPWGWRA